MNVRDLMTRDVAACRENSDLSSAALMMWRNDCGSIPVLNDQDRVIGVITDRDIAMAVATRHQNPDHIAVGDVIAGRLVAIGPADGIPEAIERMRQAQVRRVPVVDADGRLLGVLSVNDLILAAKPSSSRARGRVSADDVLDVMKAICAHRDVPHEAISAR